MIFSRSRFAGTKMYVGSPSAAPAAAVAPARLPVEAHASAPKPSSTALAAATATTRSLNEWVGFDVSVFTYSSQSRPSSAASRSALISGDPVAGNRLGLVPSDLERAEAAVAGEQRLERIGGAAALAGEVGCLHGSIPYIRAGALSARPVHIVRDPWVPPDLAPFPTVAGMVAEASQGRSLRLSGCDAGDRPR